MKSHLITALVVAAALGVPLAAQAQAPQTVKFYSEQVQVAGQLYTPSGFSPASKAPAVVLAPGWGQTAASLDAYGKALAAKGVVALALDYRGWGQSGGFLYLAQDVAMDDRLRFSNHTPKIRIRRGRLEPQAQIQDIRNAFTYLQGLAGVDRARLGVLGVDMAGGHAVALGGMDGRVKAAVGVVPVIKGQDVPRLSHQPTAAEQADLVRLARTGAPPASEAEARRRNALESRLALADYNPFWWADVVPASSSFLFLTSAEGASRRDAEAAAKVMKAAEVKPIAGAKQALTPAQTSEAATAAAAFLAAKL